MISQQTAHLALCCTFFLSAGRSQWTMQLHGRVRAVYTRLGGTSKPMQAHLADQVHAHASPHYLTLRPLLGQQLLQVPLKIHELCVSGTVARLNRPGAVQVAAATSLPRSQVLQQASRLPAITRLAASVHGADAGEELEMKAVRQQFIGRNGAEQAGALAEPLRGDATMPTDADVPAKGNRVGLTSRPKTIRRRTPVVTDV
jgi:hypothetical protein